MTAACLERRHGFLPRQQVEQVPAAVRGRRTGQPDQRIRDDVQRVERRAHVTHVLLVVAADRVRTAPGAVTAEVADRVLGEK